MGKGLKPLVGKTCRYLSNVKSTIYLSSIVMVGIDKILLPSCQDNGEVVRRQTTLALTYNRYSVCTNEGLGFRYSNAHS